MFQKGFATLSVWCMELSYFNGVPSTKNTVLHDLEKGFWADGIVGVPTAQLSFQIKCCEVLSVTTWHYYLAFSLMRNQNRSTFCWLVEGVSYLPPL